MALFRFSSVDPVDRLLALQREIDHSFRAPVFNTAFGGPARGVLPPVNVFDDRVSYVVRLEAPGVAPDQFTIETQGRSLTISGKRAAEAPEASSFHRRERDRGAFSRSLQLPEDADPSRAAASYKHGILTVTVPKREEAKPRQIAVQAA